MISGYSLLYIHTIVIIQIQSRITGICISSRHSRKCVTLLKQCSDVWDLSRLKPTLIWKDQFELICTRVFQKPIGLIVLLPNHPGKIFWGQNFDLCGSFFPHLLNWVFRTNMESNPVIWKPCGQKLLVLKICVQSLMKNLKLFNKELLINVIFFFF